jgi:hypothetical protein
MVGVPISRGRDAGESVARQPTRIVAQIDALRWRQNDAGGF